MPNFSFKLNDEFVDPYKEIRPPFGFKDAGGNSIGELSYLRTYSRKKEDGTKEQWWDTCRRVIEGMYSIQKDWAKKNRLPWSDNKAKWSAQDAYDRLFNLKWSPPGRGLWVMGTDLTNTYNNSAALQNCFTGNEKFITGQGVQTFLEAADTSVEVWTTKGWTKAEIKSFGEQPVQRITFAPAIPTSRGNGWRNARSNVRFDITATPNHRWELADGTLTTDLKVGDTVPAQAVNETEFSMEYDAGFRHGLIFADGSESYRYQNGDYLFILRLCGDKEEMKSYFSNVHYQPNCNGDPVAYYRTATNMKQIPVGQSADYARGFIKGWTNFDGSVSPSGAVVLGTQDDSAATWLIDNAAYAGYVVSGHSLDIRDTNFGTRSAPLHKITLAEFENRAWTVTTIDTLSEAEEVFCAVVPDVERFTLANGIYTSNCAFVSTADMTKYDPAGPFCFLMEASMLGVGVGFDTKGANKDLEIFEPDPTIPNVITIEDSREGWVYSVKLLLESFLMPGKVAVDFDYSLIRKAGEPIHTFGGLASGPEPLMKLHNQFRAVFAGRAGQKLTSTDIADIGNQIGACIVAGNVRRSAELLIGSINDKDFLNLKNYEAMPNRSSWSWMSNNSVEATDGLDLSPILEGIALNGEPGIVRMDVSRAYGRLADAPNNKDWRAAGYNPCAEQTLESYEMCTLVETYLNRHESLEDFKKTLKVAYLYAKTVTLLPTHWPKTNAIMQRNRRIGTSVSGIANFLDNRGAQELRKWFQEGYDTVQYYDKTYSEWLCVRESIKTTTVKPSGTVSILAGESPGVHWSPGGEYFNRAIRFAKNDPMVLLFATAGYKVEPALSDPDTTVVVYFPIRSSARRSEKQVTVFEKAALAVEAQRWWSDNSVSVTLSFDAEKEKDYVSTVLNMYDGQYKTLSFLPMGNAVYAQQPYTEITAEEYEEATMNILPLDLSGIYEGLGWDAIGERYCSTDSCDLNEFMLNKDKGE